MVIHIDDFQYLAKNVYSPKELDNLMRLAKKVTKKDAGWDDITGWIVEGAISGIASGVISTAIDLTPAGLVKTINRLFA